MIPLILSERDPCAETILNRFLQDHIFNEQRNAAVVAVQKLYFIFRVQQLGGDLHLNAVGGVDAVLSMRRMRAGVTVTGCSGASSTSLFST